MAIFILTQDNITHQYFETKSNVSKPLRSRNGKASCSGIDKTVFTGKMEASDTRVTGCLPTERVVFECLCKEYGCSAAFSEIAARTDLFPHGLECAESWFRIMKGKFLITEDGQGKIRKVHAFSAQAHLCLDYSNNGKCDNQDCTYLHICRDYITDSCSTKLCCRGSSLISLQIFNSKCWCFRRHLRFVSSTTTASASEVIPVPRFTCAVVILGSVAVVNMSVA